jgi:hypothetical protein
MLGLAGLLAALVDLLVLGTTAATLDQSALALE